jgi:hypothetical protein
MFRNLVLARIIDPVSKLGSIRVLEEVGVTLTSYRTFVWDIYSTLVVTARPERRWSP